MIVEKIDVQEIVREMNRDKTQGPDGYSIASFFFKDFGEVVKEDLMSVFHDFHAKDKVIKILNATFIAKKVLQRSQQCLKDDLSSMVDSEGKECRHFENWELRRKNLKTYFFNSLFVWTTIIDLNELSFRIFMYLFLFQTRCLSFIHPICSGVHFKYYMDPSNYFS